MREALIDLVNKTIVHQYDLPNIDISISKSVCSTDNDKCYRGVCNKSFSEIIYNSIVEYSFNNFDITDKDFNALHAIALKTKLKYNENANETSKISYGFHGETILYCILYVIFNSKPVISRGYFYNPLESSETKGYDSYHLIENDGTTELWFGEVKFRATHSSGIKSALDSLFKAISDDYLSANFMAIYNEKNSFNIKNSKVEEILLEWEKNPYINIIEEIKKHDLKLVYPIVILYNENSKGFDTSIKDAVDYIEKIFAKKAFNISIPYSVYFILLPVNNVKTIKTKVIEWIELKKPLMS